MTNQRVYAVIGGWDYEGENFASLRLFDCQSAAKAYEWALTEVEGFDYALMQVRGVSQVSLFSLADPVD